MEPQATQLRCYLFEKVKFIVISCLIYRVLKNTQSICFPLVLLPPYAKQFLCFLLFQIIILSFS